MEKLNLQKLNESDTALVEAKENRELNQKKYSELVDNIQSEYLKNNDAMVGSIIAQDDYYGKNDHTNELECARWLVKKFGGVVVLLSESEIDGVKTADFLWDGKLWDLKTPTGSGKRTIDNQFAKIKNQIIHNPGGMILDCTYLSNSNFEVIESVSKRMILSCFVGDVIVVRNAHIVDILHNNKR